MRFYNTDGIEEDVQDQAFFMDEDKLLEQQEALEEMLSLYD